MVDEYSHHANTFAPSRGWWCASAYTSGIREATTQSMKVTRAADSPGEAGGERIEIHVAALDHLFNAMDPSPLHERDLAPSAEEFIVAWASDAPPHIGLSLVVYTDRREDPATSAAILQDAIRKSFARQSESSRRRLRQLFRRGRASLVIAVAFLGVMIALGDAAAAALQGRRIAEIVREGFLIGGWVAMWRPLEIFLYDWWPIRAEARLFDRLSAMSVRVICDGVTPQA
jgi:hypothetical protein